MRKLDNKDKAIICSLLGSTLLVMAIAALQLQINQLSTNYDATIKLVNLFNGDLKTHMEFHRAAAQERIKPKPKVRIVMKNPKPGAILYHQCDSPNYDGKGPCLYGEAVIESGGD
jgi:hypothetical protein